MKVVKEYTQADWMTDGKTVYALHPDSDGRICNRFFAGFQRGGTHSVTDAELEANALLSAAAPKLVEAIIDRAEKAASAYWKECQGHVGVDNEFRPESNYLQDCWAHHLTEKELEALRQAGILRD